MGRADVLKPWVIEALEQLGGSAGVLEVSRVVWASHQQDLERHGDLFYTWQYDIRWAAQKLRDEGRLVAMNGQRNSKWALSSSVSTDETDDWLTSDDGY